MIFRSPHPDVAVPDIALHRFVLARAAERGTKPALIDGPSGRILTYAALTRGADRVAAGGPARGFQKGGVVGLVDWQRTRLDSPHSQKSYCRLFFLKKKTTPPTSRR